MLRVHDMYSNIVESVSDLLGVANCAMELGENLGAVDRCIANGGLLFYMDWYITLSHILSSPLHFHFLSALPLTVFCSFPTSLCTSFVPPLSLPFIVLYNWVTQWTECEAAALGKCSTPCLHLVFAMHVSYWLHDHELALFTTLIVRYWPVILDGVCSL